MTGWPARWSTIKEPAAIGGTMITDPTNILSAEDVATDTHVTIRITEGKNPRAALQRLIKNDREYGYVIDNDDKFHGIVSTETLRELLDDLE